MTTVANTIKRGEIYHFNHRIGEKVYRKSLKTDSPSQCRKYVSGIISYIKRCAVLGVKVEKQDIDKFIEILISNKLNEVVRLGKAATQPMSNTAKSYFDMWYRQTAEARDYNDMVENSGFGAPCDIDVSAHLRDYPSYTQWLSAKIESASDYCHLVSALTNFDEDGNREIDTDHPMYWEFKVPTHGSEWFTHLDRQVSNHAKNISNAVSKNHSVRARMELTELQTKFSDLLPNTPPSVHPITTEETTSPTFNDLRPEYELHCKQLGWNKMDARIKHLDTYAVELGEIPIDKIDLSMLAAQHQVLLQLPTEKPKNGIDSPFRGVPVEKRWEVAKDSDTELSEDFLYSESNLKKYRTTLTDFFSWVVDVKALVDKNPMPQTRTPTYKKYFSLPTHRKTRRANFSDEQAKTITNYCTDNLSNPLNWAVLLMGYHGMRNSEVANLTKSRVITHEETGVVYMYVNKGKTQNAERCIPVHDHLLRLGFVEFVQACKTESLFSFKPNAMYIYYFSKLKNELDLPDSNELGLPLSLYSFRHSFVTKLSQAKAGDAYIKSLVGHSDTTANYTHLRSSKDMLEFQRIVNTVEY